MLMADQPSEVTTVILDIAFNQRERRREERTFFLHRFVWIEECEAH